MLEIDLWALAGLDDVTEKVLAAYEAYDFQAAYNAIYNFCTVTLSARYFDIIKDRLYILAPKSIERRSAQTALYRIADSLCRLLSPILAFTSDEAWENLPGRTRGIGSHRRVSKGRRTPTTPALLTNWERIFSIRDEVLKALEEARNDKQIGSSLEAKVILTTDAETTRFLLDYYDQLRYIFIVSQVEVHEGDTFERRDPKGRRRKMRTLLELFDPRRRIRKISDRLRTLQRGAREIDLAVVAKSTIELIDLRILNK